LLKNTPSIIAIVAALGLVGLTISPVVRPAADLNIWHVSTMVLAWVVVLATSLATRDHELDEDAFEDPPAIPQPDRRIETAPMRELPATQPLPPGSASLLDFARELHGTLESDRLRLLIARRLPVLLGVRDVWIVARVGTRQQMIVPSHLTGGPLVTEELREWSTYPMKADGRTVGIMGVAAKPGGFNERDHRLIKLTASFIAQALLTVDTFETLRETSLVDGLTGCATRVEGLRRFEAELRRADRSESTLAVIMLDLDHFKIVNDHFGHKAGDAVLTAIGETLLTTLRASDVRSRWGGEEFLLVLPDSNAEQAQRASENLRQRIANTPVEIGQRVISVTASIGLTLSRPRENDIQQLIGRADTALYEAKRRGRNRVAFVPSGGHADMSPAEPSIQGPVRVHGWNGPERRDATRQDRRLVPSPGRRATDSMLTGPRRDR
jgi:diguanylate cyclase (GGDEF)-like protein